MATVLAIVPKLALTGGNLEVERLLRDLKTQGCAVSILPLYSRKTSLPAAFLGAPCFTLGAILKILQYKPEILIVTHYTTLPYALLGRICRFKSIAFVQDFEWLFVSRNTSVQLFVKAYHLLFYLFVDCFVFGNRYLEAGFPTSAKNARLFGVRPRHILYPVGSKSDTKVSVQPRRRVGFILRKGWLKNQLMYHNVFSCLIASRKIHPAFLDGIDMLDSSASSSKFAALGIHLSPPKPPAEVPAWMASLNIFLCLSIHEGFGLPPLEAMCQGAIPIVLMNGGCTAYMEPFPELIISPNASAEDVANKIASVLSRQDAQLSLLRRRLKEHATQYLSWADKARHTASATIANL
jgi:glycosyltransferase involved in cell wall biosynthesis